VEWKRPSLIVCFMVNLLGTWGGWFRCPEHGLVHDKLEHRMGFRRHLHCPFNPSHAHFVFYLE